MSQTRFQCNSHDSIDQFEPADSDALSLDTDFHRRWPWSPKRWQFAQQRMQALTPEAFARAGPKLLRLLNTASSVHGVGNLRLGKAFRVDRLARASSGISRVRQALQLVHRLRGRGAEVASP